MLNTATLDASEAKAPAKDTPRVRSAVPDDFKQLMTMCLHLHEENGVSHVEWTKVAAILIKGINQDSAIIGVIGDVGKIEGMIFMQISQFWYSNEPILEELFNYVLPEYRRSGNAKALVDFAKGCSQGLRVPLLIGVISNHRTEEKIELYKRRLGKPSGAFFLVNAVTGH